MGAPDKGPGRPGDRYVPRHGDARFRVESYDLELDYRVNSNRLIGRATITGVAAEALSRISLDLTGLRVSKVAVNGRRPTRYAHRDGKLHITSAVAPATSSRSTFSTAGIRVRFTASGASSAGRS